VINHPLTGFEIQGQIHVTECCDSMAGYYILDAQCVMLNAKVRCAVAGFLFRVAHAATQIVGSLPTTIPCAVDDNISNILRRFGGRDGFHAHGEECAEQQDGSAPKLCGG
jgi:translation initiation factor RLI1